MRSVDVFEFVLVVVQTHIHTHTSINTLSESARD
jgi:hypothetical protein